MRLADKLTLTRVILSPLFFGIYFLFMRPPVQVFWAVPTLWLIFIISEITDMLDGMAARKLNQTSDFGKLFDPFADTLMQLTCFLCFVIDGVMPAALFLVVLYREFGILFIRNLMLRKGIAMGARISGKIKTVTYITAAAAALFYVSLRQLDAAVPLQPVMSVVVIVIFSISVFFSVLSFFDYFSAYRAAGKAAPSNS